jgi:hypothetical protein
VKVTDRDILNLIKGMSSAILELQPDLFDDHARKTLKLIREAVDTHLEAER